jgi:hypothetical protein
MCPCSPLLRHSTVWVIFASTVTHWVSVVLSGLTGLLGCLSVAVCGILLPYLVSLLVWVMLTDLCWLGCCLFGLFVPVQPLNFSDFCCAGIGLIGAFLKLLPLSCLVCLVD